MLSLSINVKLLSSAWVFCRDVNVPDGASLQHTKKTELKDVTIIDRHSNALHHQAKEALHIHIKDPSLNRNIGKVRNPYYSTNFSNLTHN